MSEPDAFSKPDPVLPTEPTTVAAVPPADSLTSPLTLGGVVAGVLVIIGSIGPWAKIESISLGGLDRDGAITLALAIIVLLAVIARRFQRTALVIAVLCAAVAIYDTIDVGTTSDPLVSVSVGWGVVLAAIGSVGLVAWGVLASLQARRAKATIA